MKSGYLRPLAVAAVLAAWMGAAQAQDKPKPAEPPMTPSQKAEAEKLRNIMKNTHPVFGDVKIPGAEATLHLGKDYYYVNPTEARDIIVNAWGNPPSNADEELGLVFPKDGNFVDSWGAIITYEKTGYVEDKDAKTADYGKLVKQVQDGEEEVNAERSKGGYPSIHLVGWAQAPSYDPARHSEIWARDIKFSDDEVHTLNYDIRLLGRRGVLSLNMVSSMPKLAEVRAAAVGLAQRASYDPGARYEDYRPGSDLKAAYGVGGLVAAGLGLAVAKKIGLIGVILLFAKKGIVLILAAAGAVGAWFKRMFSKATGRGGPPAKPPTVS